MIIITSLVLLSVFAMFLVHPFVDGSETQSTVVSGPATIVAWFFFAWVSFLVIEQALEASVLLHCYCPSVVSLWYDWTDIRVMTVLAEDTGGSALPWVLFQLAHFVVVLVYHGLHFRLKTRWWILSRWSLSRWRLRR